MCFTRDAEFSTERICVVLDVIARCLTVVYLICMSRLSLYYFYQTDHTLLVGNGANKFAAEMGIPTVPTKQLVTNEAVKEWEQYHQYKLSVNTFFKQR